MVHHRLKLTVVYSNRNDRRPQNVVISVKTNNEEFFFYLAFENSVSNISLIKFGTHAIDFELKHYRAGGLFHKKKHYVARKKNRLGVKV